MNEEKHNAVSARGARAQFEAWAKSEGYECDPAEPGMYYQSEDNRAWKIWQAALAARQPVGVEPIAFADLANWKAGLGADECFFTDWQDDDTVPVYAAPPEVALILSAPKPGDGSDAPWYMLADLVADQRGPNGEPMFKTRDRVVPVFAAPAPAAVPVDVRDSIESISDEMERFHRKWQTVGIDEFRHYAERIKFIADQLATHPQPAADGPTLAELFGQPEARNG